MKGESRYERWFRIKGRDFRVRDGLKKKGEEINNYESRKNW